MAYKVNYRNAYTVLPQGEYEVVIADVYEDFTQAGYDAEQSSKTFVVLYMVVRNDVAQAYQNKGLRMRLYLSDNALPYSQAKMDQISRIVALEDNTEYENYSAWGDAIRGRVMRVRVRHREYGGQLYEDVQTFMASTTPECHHVWQNGQDDARRRAARFETQTPAVNAQPPAGFIPVDEDDLPF